MHGPFSHGEVSVLTPGHELPLQVLERWIIDFPQVTGHCDHCDQELQPLGSQFGEGGQARAWLMAFLLKKWSKSGQNHKNFRKSNKI